MKNLLAELSDWRLTVDENKFGWLIFDKRDSRVNVLSQSTMDELGQALSKIETLVGEGRIKGLGCLSAKEGSFILGADVHEFVKLANEAQVRAVIEDGHAVMQRIEDLKCPTAVGIHGLALGGGFEFALSFDVIIAVEDRNTKVGFPEVQLGIMPGFGGTARSVSRAGPEDAVRVMVTGKQIQASDAKAMGLVDQLVSAPKDLEAAVLAVIVAPPAKPESKLACLSSEAASQARQQTALKMRPEHYPAPFAIIEQVEKNGANLASLYKGELDIFPGLMMSQTSKALRRTFGLRDRLKKQTRSRFKVRRVHVVGAGLMGGDIAAYCAMLGLEVSLQDLDLERITPALKRAEKLFAKRLSGEEQQKAADRLVSDVEGARIADADVVIEAVIERLDVKQQVFASLEAKARTDALLASNTSALPLENIAEGLKDPGRLIGLHFFNPAPLMPLVEVVWGRQSAQEEIDRALAFCGQIRKSPVKVKSSKGFLVNRALLPYMAKALNKMLEGTPKEEIDAALLKFGMPMGPIELSDQVGLDVTLFVCKTLGLSEGSAIDALQAKIDAGQLGMKSGEGFYSWNQRKPIRDLSSYEGRDLSVLADEIIQPMIDECLKAVEEGVVEDADMADIGIILGTGFAPFRGGPLNYHASRIS